LNDNSTVNLEASSSDGIQSLTFAQIDIGPGGSVTVANAATHSHRALLIANGLSIAPTGKLDLGSNDMLLHSGNLPTLSNELSSGYSNGTWTGAGISSSAAAVDPSHLTTLGMLLNNNGAESPIYSSTPGSLGLFDGLSPLVTDILIKYTWYGDANLDGKVDGSDYSRIDSGAVTHATGWYNGDFNYDGVINGSDYTLIDNAYNSQGPSLSPETAKNTGAKTSARIEQTTAIEQAASATSSLSRYAKPASLISLLEPVVTAVHSFETATPAAPGMFSLPSDVLLADWRQMPASTPSKAADNLFAFDPFAASQKLRFSEQMIGN